MLFGRAFAYQGSQNQGRGLMHLTLVIMLGVAIVAFCVPLGASGFILSPLLVAIALSATSVGILVPVLRDTGHMDTAVGHFTMGGASAAEVGTIALLGVFFAGREKSAAVSALLLVVVAILAVLLLAALRYTLRWTPGQRIFAKLDDSSAQARVRFSVMILLAAATLAMRFGFEGIGRVSALVLPAAATALLGGSREEAGADSGVAQTRRRQELAS